MADRIAMSAPAASRRALQIVSYILALVPILTGAVGLLGLDDPLYAGAARQVALDSNLRFFAGFWLAMGAAFLWAARHIETETILFRAIWAAIFLGGVGRALSMLVAGPPPAPFIGFTALELIGAPLFVWWQSRIARA